MRRVATAAMIVWGLLMGPAAADQKDPELPGLLARLAASADARLSDALEARVWSLWLRHGDGAVGRAMAAGLRAMTEGRNEDAAGDFSEALALAPDFAEAWNRRATVYYLLGRLRQSEGDIARVLALEPRHFGALSGLGLVKTAQGEAGAALEALERAQAVHPMMAGVRERVRALRRRLRGEPI